MRARHARDFGMRQTAASRAAMSGARAAKSAAAAALACSALLLGGCGSNSLSDKQLRRKAARICVTAQRASASLAAPTDPTKGEPFLQRGIAALAPQIAALHKLNPSGDLADAYGTALRDTDHELALLRRALHGLKAGNDPVVAIKTLQDELGPAEDAAGRAWHEVEVPACAKRDGLSSRAHRRQRQPARPPHGRPGRASQLASPVGAPGNG